MKNILTKIGYMAFGGLLTLIGYHFGNIDNNSADAQVQFDQEKAEIVDEIRCRRLVIVGDDDTPRITLGTTFLDRGAIEVCNEDGARRIFLDINNVDGGSVTLIGKNSGGTAVWLGVDDNGGFLSLFNKVIDNPVLNAAITSKGHGAIVVNDRSGNQIGALGPLGIFQTKQKWRNQ